MARQRRERTLLEWNVLLSTVAVHGAEREVTRWSAMKAMAQAMKKASRVGEFIAMWAIAKYELGEVTTERVAERWGMNERTAYRRLGEFREVWGPPGLKVQYETPDPVADLLIADYRARRRRVDDSMLPRLISQPVVLPAGTIGAV